MRKIFVILTVIFALSSCLEAAEISKQEIFKLAAEGSAKQLMEAVKSGINLNISAEYEDFDEDCEYEEAAFENVTPLHFAAAHNHNSEVIEFLISLGLDVNEYAYAGNYTSETPLSFAIINHNLEAFMALLKAGADPNSYNGGYNNSMFHLVASECRDYEQAKTVIDALIAAGGDINSHEKFTRKEIQELHEDEGSEGFMIIWSEDDPFGEAIYELSRVTRGNFLSSFTPLMFAVLYDNPDVVNVLLDAGADTKIQSLEGKNALDYALMLPKTTKLRRSEAFRKLQRKTPPARK